MIRALTSSSLKKIMPLIPIRKLSTKQVTHTRKVSIIGAGSVGCACANTLLNKGFVREICLIDDNYERCQGEIWDLQEGSTWLDNPRVIGGTDYALTCCSEVVIITAGARQKPTQTRYDILKQNIDIVKSVGCILDLKSVKVLSELVISNPVDIMTQIAWEKSGLPLNRVIGTGTTIDTLRFQYYLSKRLDVAPSECQGWVLGAHGEYCVPIWSSLHIAGFRMRDVYPEMGKKTDMENWNEVYKKVVSAGPKIIKMKGYTNWCIALCAAILTEDIFKNTMKIRPVSTAALGHYNIDKNIFLSLPCIILSDGLKDVVRLPLDSNEKEKMKEAANNIHQHMTAINF